MGQICCIAETPSDEDAAAVQPNTANYQSVLSDGDPQSNCVAAEDVPRLLDGPRRAIAATAAAADLRNGKDPAGQTGPKKMVMLLQDVEHLVDGGLDEWLRGWCTDEVLRTFLGASSTESAVKSLATALNWRRRYKDVLTGLRTPCWQGDMRVVARGVSGHPVIFMSMQHQPSKSNSISTAEHLAVVLEAAVCSAKGTPRSFDVVCDCRGFQLSKNLDPRPAVSAMEMLKHAYRGRMRRAFLVGAPAAFGGFWKLLKGLLPKPTQCSSQPPSPERQRSHCQLQSDEDGDSCAICHSALGKRHFNPRHHCRLCCRPVCASCSPCRVPLSGQKGVQRSCLQCAATASRASALTQQLSFLSRQLSDLAGRPTADVAPVTLEDALSSLEAAVEPLRKLRVQHKITERRCHEAEDQLHNLRTEFNRNRDCEQDPRLITPGPLAPGHGQEDSETDCWICHARLGKRFLNPRHHCRACGRLVCGQCSPSRILMDGRTTLQRACAQCTRSVQEVPNATRRLQVLAAGLSALLGTRSNPTSAAGLCSRLATLGTLEGAIRECEEKIQFIALKEAGDVLQGSCGPAAAHVVTTLLASDQDSTSWRFPSELAD
eukprot:s2470_g13.t1